MKGYGSFFNNQKEKEERIKIRCTYRTFKYEENVFYGEAIITTLNEKGTQAPDEFNNPDFTLIAW